MHFVFSIFLCFVSKNKSYDDLVAKKLFGNAFVHFFARKKLYRFKATNVKKSTGVNFHREKCYFCRLNLIKNSRRSSTFTLCSSRKVYWKFYTSRLKLAYNFSVDSFLLNFFPQPINEKVFKIKKFEKCSIKIRSFL